MGNCSCCAQYEETYLEIIAIDAVQRVFQNQLLLEKILKYVMWSPPHPTIFDASSMLWENGPLKRNVSYADVWMVLRTSQSWRQMGLLILTRQGIPLYDLVNSYPKGDLNINVRVNTKRKRFLEFPEFLNITKAFVIPPLSLNLEYVSFTQKQFMLLHSPNFDPYLMTLVHLTLKSTTFSVTAPSLPATPSLHLPRLRWLNVIARPGCLYPEFRAFVQQIMDGAPRLQKMGIFKLPSITSDSSPSPTEFSQWRLPPTLTSFQGWNLNDTILHDLFLCPNKTRTGLHLKSVRMWKPEFVHMSKTLYKILHLYRHTLEDVQLWNYVFDPVEFPEMSSLLRLKALTGFNLGFHANHYQPRREQLEILREKISRVSVLCLAPAEDFLWTCQTGRDDKKGPKFDAVLEFEAKLDDNEEGEGRHFECLQKSSLWKLVSLQEAFPNILRLCLDLNHTKNPAEQIKFLFSHFPLLSSLTLTWRCSETICSTVAQDEIDSLLLGCPAHLIPHIRKSPTVEQFLPESLDDAKGEFPSVRLLTQLTALRLTVSFNLQSIVPSDLSFRYGFFQMSRLTTLRIGSTRSINEWPSSDILKRWKQERGFSVEECGTTGLPI